MPLILGIPFTAFLAIAVAALSNRFGLDLYWVLAGLSGLWAWRDSQRHDLQRFERTFPLEARAAGFSVALAWPVAFPWYLRLRHRALTGRLTAHPARRSVRGPLIGLGIVGVCVAGFLLWIPHFLGNISEVSARVGRITRDPVEISIENGHDLTIVVINSSIPPDDEDGQRLQAMRLAREARAAYSKRRDLRLVRVTYVRRSRVAGGIEARVESQFEWPANSLASDTWISFRGDVVTRTRRAEGA
jgi:hypothetical protein